MCDGVGVKTDETTPLTAGGFTGYAEWQCLKITSERVQIYNKIT